MAGSLYQTCSVNQRAATEYGANYPFVLAPTAVKYLLGDLWLSYPDNQSQYVLPFQVTSMTGFSSGSKNMVIKDANGATVFNTSTATGSTQNNWGKSMVTLSWTDGITVLRCTMRTVAPAWEPGLTWSNSITLTNAWLDSRTYDRLPLRVRAVKVGATTLTACNIKLAEGYNISLTAIQLTPVDGGRLVQQITIQANPGDGIGQVPGCEDTVPVLQRINAVSPAAGGNFTLDMDGNYRIQRPVTVIDASPASRTVTLTNPNALQLYNDGGPCCTCEDFVNTYEGLRALTNQYQALGVQAESVRDTFQLNIDRWNAQLTCRQAQNVNLVTSPERYGVLFVGGLSCNNTTCCAVPLVLRTTFEYFRNGMPISVTGMTMVKCQESKRIGADTNYEEAAYQPMVNWPVMDHFFDYADPQGTSRFRNRIQFPAGMADTVRTTLSVHLPNIFDPVTGKPCPLLENVTVPPEVAAIWQTWPPAYPVRALIQQVSPVSQTAGCCA